MYLLIVIHRLRSLQKSLLLRLHRVYFCARNFHSQMHMVRKTGAENRRQKMASIYGAGFWSVCHG